jgi:hypothetical protein
MYFIRESRLGFWELDFVLGASTVISTVYYQTSNICQLKSKQQKLSKWLVARHLLFCQITNWYKNVSVAKRCITQKIVDPKYWETIEISATN